MAKGKEVTRPESQAVAQVKQGGGEVAPDYARNKAGQGSQSSMKNSSDFIVPRVKLLHGTSLEPQQFNSAKVGNFWANVMDKDLGNSLDFIICRDRTRVILLRPIDDKTGESILARAEDGVTWDRTGKWNVKLKGHSKPDIEWEIANTNVRASGLMEFGTSDPKDENSNPAATLFYDYLVFMPDHQELGPALFSMARTATKRAKGLNTKVNMRCESTGVDMQSLKFRAIVTTEDKDGQKYFNMDFQNNGFATEVELDRCLKIAERFKDFQGAGEEDTGENVAGAPKERGEV